jgi:hypothetical protein
MPRNTDLKVLVLLNLVFAGDHDLQVVGDTVLYRAGDNAITYAAGPLAAPRCWNEEWFVTAILIRASTAPRTSAPDARGLNVGPSAKLLMITCLELS